MLMQFSTFRKCKSNTHAILIFEESLSPMFMQLSTFWKSKFNTHAILIFIESLSPTLMQFSTFWKSQSSMLMQLSTPSLPPEQYSFNYQLVTA